MPPAAADYRHVLSDGTVVYLAPSHEFPLVNLAITFKGGSSLDPADLPGLAAMTARLVREGGTAAMPPAEVDETLDFLATEVSVSASDTFTTATMNCLKSTFDESLTIFLAMLRTPAFDAGRLETAKARLLAKWPSGTTTPARSSAASGSGSLFGADHFEAPSRPRRPSRPSRGSGSPACTGEIFHPGNVIIAVSGDFDERRCSPGWSRRWPAGSGARPAPDPGGPPTAALEPGLYHVPKEIPQGKVVIGLPVDRAGRSRRDPAAACSTRFSAAVASPAG